MLGCCSDIQGGIFVLLKLILEGIWEYIISPIGWIGVGFFFIMAVLAQFYRAKSSKEEAKNVEVVITSIANKKVRGALFECIDNTRKIMGVSPLVLINEGSELTSELEGKIGKEKIILVPEGFKKKLKGKGRALCFFIKWIAKSDAWYVFLDDDTKLLDRKFMSEISYYKEKGYSVANGIIVPREGKSKMTYIMDFIRYFDDLFIYRFFTGLLGKPLLGLHGDLLIIEGSVLKNIDLDKASVAEDYVFAVELIRKKCKTWQSKSHISFLSANSLPDLAKQRKRWSQGMKENFNDSPILMKLAIIFRTIIGGLWTVGAITVLLIPLLGVAHLVVPAAVYPLEYVLKMVFFTIPAGIYIWIVYIYGIAKAKKWLYLILIVIFGILEVAPDFSNKRDEEFVVIDKN